MENKFKEFWIELEEKGARAFVYTEPVDGLNDDAIHTVEYAALEAANAEIKSLLKEVALLNALEELGVDNWEGYGEAKALVKQWESGDGK